MRGFDRRRVLRSVGAGLGTAFAGCLSDRPGDTATDVHDPPRSETPSPTPGDGSGIEYDVQSLSVGLSAPRWYRDDHDSPGHVDYFASAAAARDGLDLDAVSDDRRAEVEAFVDATDFSRSRLLAVASVGPNTCHGVVEVDGLSLSGDSLVGEARTVDTSDPGEGCGEAVTFPSVLVRVRFDGDPRDRVRLTVTDGWGNEGTISATADGGAIDPTSLPGHVRPEGAPDTVPGELVCDEGGFHRHVEGFSGRPPWGETEGDGWGSFALRADRLAVDRGGSVTITLTNLGPEEGSTGSRNKYNLQVRTEAGWQDVRGFPDGRGGAYTDEAIGHRPGEGFEWSFEFTPEGVIDGHANEDTLEVCPGLPAGRYRFVFWEPTVAVAFDLRE